MASKLNLQEKQNKKILERFRYFIVVKDYLKLKSLKIRRESAKEILSAFRLDNSERRNLFELRTLYIYKCASEKNLIAEHVFPKNHFEDWLFATLIEAFKNHVGKIKAAFNIVCAFFKNDIRARELFRVEYKRTLDMTPCPPLPRFTWRKEDTSIG